MFRVYLDGNTTMEFYSYNAFAAWRLKVSAEGYKPGYVCRVRLRGNDCIYIYKLCKTGGAVNA